MEELHRQLTDQLSALTTSEDWLRALEVAARFHHYSFANTLLIHAQGRARGFAPTRVAGYRRWQELGRQVGRGEQGLAILAPLTRRLRDPEPADPEADRRVVVGFRTVFVFDISQTEGAPLPEVRPRLVEGERPPQWERLVSLIREAGFAFSVGAPGGEANGVTDFDRRRVVVRATLPEAQQFSTALHELAHIRLHHPEGDTRPDCRGVREVEAQSVAHMVATALGVDASGYTLPYVASWSGGDLALVHATGTRVVEAAHRVLLELEVSREPTPERPQPARRLEAGRGLGR